VAVPFGYTNPAFRVRPSQLAGDDRDIFTRIAEGALSNLSKAANVLDLPASSVRDVLAWENPFDQWIPGNWTTDQNRTSGRELLETWGVLGQNQEGFDWGDVAGVATEVVSDPLFWITGPARALTSAGQVAKRADLLGHVAKITGRGVGPRAGRISTTLDDVLKAFPEATEKAQRAAEGMGVTLDAVRHQRLGGLSAFGPPIGNPWAVFGAADESLPAATVLDNIGAAIRWSSPVRAGYQMFGGRSMQAGTRIGQETANAAFDARTTALAESRHAISDIAAELQRKGVLDPDPFEAGNQLYRWIEGHDQAPAEISALIDRARQLNGDILADAQEWGIRREMLDDPNIPFYTPRYKAGSGASRSSRPFSVADESGIAREDILRSGPWGGIQGGTETLRRVARDVGSLLENAKAAGVALDDDDVARYIDGQFGGLVSDEYSRWLPQQSAYEQAFGRHKRLAKTLMKEFETDPDVLRAGLYTDPVTSLQRYTERSLDIVETGKAVLQTLADPEAIDIARRAASTAEEIPVATLLDSLKFDLDAGQGKGALSKLAQLTGRSIDDVAAMSVPRELADDLMRMTQAFSGPEPTNAIMRVVDNITGLTKAGQTSIWPAFHVRNLFSGQFRNWIAGMWDAGSVNDAWRLARGGTVKSAAEIPIIRKTLQDRGQQITDEAATDVLREFVYAHGLAGRGQSEAFARAGINGAQQATATSSPYGAMDSVLSQFPGGFEGQNPFSLRQTAREFFGQTPETQFRRPWEVRGVGERTASTFGPVVAGESISELTENLNRAAPFIHQLRQGIDPAAAAQKVLAAQVDYGTRSYSKFETQIAQRLFPYWRFSSRQIPYVANELLERPGGLMGQTLRVIDSMRDTDDPLPEHIASTTAIPLGQSPDGTRSYLTGFGLMEEDAMRLAPFGVRDTLQEIGSRLNPLARAPVEWAFNQSLFFGGPSGGRDLEDLDPPVGRLLRNVEQTLTGDTSQREPYKLPQAVEFLAANSPVSRFLTTGRTLFDPRKSALDRAMNVGTGFRNTDVSPAVQDRVYADALSQVMREDGARVFEKLYFAGGPSTPREAQMMALMEELRQRQRERGQRRNALLGAR
jgi:hypothetical protein